MKVEFPTPSNCNECPCYHEGVPYRKDYQRCKLGYWRVEKFILGADFLTHKFKRPEKCIEDYGTD